MNRCVVSYIASPTDRLRGPWCLSFNSRDVCVAIVIPETQQQHGEGSMSLSASAFLIWSLADNL